jgi:hypothetical protein
MVVWLCRTEGSSQFIVDFIELECILFLTVVNHIDLMMYFKLLIRCWLSLSILLYKYCSSHFPDAYIPQLFRRPLIRVFPSSCCSCLYLYSWHYLVTTWMTCSLSHSCTPSIACKRSFFKQNCVRLASILCQCRQTWKPLTGGTERD